MSVKYLNATPFGNAARRAKPRHHSVTSPELTHATSSGNVRLSMP